MLHQLAFKFDGKTFEAKHDAVRLGAQLQSVRLLMSDGRWRTLDEIGEALGFPTASISARLRDLRKARFGSHTVDRRARGDRGRGLFEYRVTSGGK